MLKINVRKNFYQNEHVFSLDFSLESAKNEDIFLLGKSGSGKTTVLNMIAGIVEPDMGEINVGGKAWYKYKNTK
jgi:ABC-type Fe3+/spermidine/putrescine transport system ATPase subunit